MIPEVGQFALIMALLLALTQATIPMIGAARGVRSWMAVAVPAGQAQFVFIAIAFCCLGYSFITNDFTVINVATNSNSQLPLHYRLAATWGSHEGSLLLWTFMLALWTVAVSLFSRHLPEEMVARVLSVMSTDARVRYLQARARVSSSPDFVALLRSDERDRIYFAREGRKGSPQLGWERMDYPLESGNWPIVSASRVSEESRIPNSRIRASPAWCPSVSLTFLKRSRSRKSTANW